MVHPGKLPGVWSFFQKLDKPLDSGKNTRCIVAGEDGKEGGRLCKHVARNGTRPLLDHLQKKHVPQYDLAMAAGNKSTKAKQEKGKAYATAAAARGQSFFPGQKKTLITPQLKERLDRLSVIWCVQSERRWTALIDPGHKLMLAEFVPEYAATDTSHRVLNEILLENVPDGEGFPCRPAQGSLRGTAEDRLSRPVLLSTAGLDIDWHRRVLHSLGVGDF
ncbi:unnamed protein product [Ectocarpus sp. 12 AP-2014]